MLTSPLEPTDSCLPSGFFFVAILIFDFEIPTWVSHKILHAWCLSEEDFV